jgi:hypothetical protein
MLGIAFKEWAVICRALALGRQSLIIRKGGIAETGGIFTPEHSRFWLYPTHFHEQQQKGVIAAAQDLLQEAEANRAPTGMLRFTHFVEVGTVTFVEKLESALALNGLHVWSSETIVQRFHYRTPGLYVLPVRVWRAGPHEVPEQHEYAGCKTWVELSESLCTEPREGILDDDEYAKALNAIRDRLRD